MLIILGNPRYDMIGSGPLMTLSTHQDFKCILYLDLLDISLYSI